MRCKTIHMVLGVFAFLALVSFSGCGSSCRELADRICDCQPTQAKKDSCHTSISASDSSFDPSDEQEDLCQRILDSGQCTCESLAAGHWAQCGLAENPLD